jgi:hypothetical protein
MTDVATGQRAAHDAVRDAAPEAVVAEPLGWGRAGAAAAGAGAQVQAGRCGDRARPIAAGSTTTAPIASEQHGRDAGVGEGPQEVEREDEQARQGSAARSAR